MSSGEVVNNIYCNTLARPSIGEVECLRPPEVDCSKGSLTLPADDIPISAASTDGSSEVSSSGIRQGTDVRDANPTGPPPPGASPGADTLAAGAGDTGDPAGTGEPRNAPSTPEGPVSTNTGADGSNGNSGDTPPAATGPSGGSSGTDSRGGAPQVPVDVSGSGSSAGGSGGVGNAVAGNTAGSSSGSTGAAGGSGTLDIGVDATLPTWLLNNPTPTLKAMLECTGGYALSTDAVCCQGWCQASCLFVCVWLCVKMIPSSITTLRCICGPLTCCNPRCAMLCLSRVYWYRYLDRQGRPLL